MQKGDIINCLIGLFSPIRHYCVVIDLSSDGKSLTVLPITSRLDVDEECICYTCDSNCSKIKLTREDTNKNFTKISYLFLKKYEILNSDCNCQGNTVYNNFISKSLKSKLKHYKIYV